MKLTEIKKKIFEKCNDLNLKFDAKGYLTGSNGDLIITTDGENLIDTVENWDEIKNEIDSGQGGELKKDKNGYVKFNAVHSSSALGVNNFAPFKKLHKDFTFLNNSDFSEVSFEKKTANRN